MRRAAFAVVVILLAATARAGGLAELFARLRAQSGALPSAPAVVVSVSSAAVVADVAILNYEFVPAIVTIKRGESVRWTNKDQDPHSAVGTTPVYFNTGPLDTAGASQEIVFETAGTYVYRCSYHPHMKAQVIVQ